MSHIVDDSGHVADMNFFRTSRLEELEGAGFKIVKSQGWNIFRIHAMK